MNKYKLRMRTLTGLGNEYVYVYATSNFERYLNKHNLKYARDITKDYQLTDRFEKLQQENQELKEKVILLKASEPMLELTKYINEKDLYKERINKAIGHIIACGCALSKDETRYLLEILKGGD